MLYLGFWKSFLFLYSKKVCFCGRCYAESGEKYTQKGQVSEELLLAMRKASPIQHAHKVRAPTLLQIGSKDLRVPPSQATDFYHRLKANGTKVR